MGMFLNSVAPYEKYKAVSSDMYFVDKAAYLAERYPELTTCEDIAIWDVLSDIFEKTKQKFVFVIDEWDAVFHMPFITMDNQKQYLLFLKTLLKSKAYVELAYMTGILPNNSESELSALVNLVYLSARDKYRVEREDKAGEGYVDFVFYPVRQSAHSGVKGRSYP